MLGILGLIFVIVAPIFIYRTAKQNGRNAVGWTLAALGVGLLASGYAPDEIQAAANGPVIIIGVVSLILSIVGVSLIMRQVSKIPEEKPFTAPPTPPAKFD